MWYHVTPIYIGKEPILQPRIPKNANTAIEGDIPRICVSDTVFKCLRALRGKEHLYAFDCREMFEENPCVYFTEEIPYIPPNCVDFRYNSERWFTKKTKFFFLWRVDLYYLFRYNKVVPTKDKELKLLKSNKVISNPKELFMFNILRGV